MEQVTGAPADHCLLYQTGGVIVATSTGEQSEQPDLGSIVSISPDNGTTWLPIPAPGE